MAAASVRRGFWLSFSSLSNQGVHEAKGKQALGASVRGEAKSVLAKELVLIHRHWGPNGSDWWFGSCMVCLDNHGQLDSLEI